MSGKTRLDIVRDGLVAHFDAGNRHSYTHSSSYDTVGATTSGSYVYNIAKYNRNLIGHPTYLTKNDSYSFAKFPNFRINSQYDYGSTNYPVAYFEIASGSANTELGFFQISDDLPKKKAIEFDDEFTFSAWVYLTPGVNSDIMLLQWETANNTWHSGSIILTRKVPFENLLNENLFALKINTTISPGIADAVPDPSGSFYNWGHIAEETSTPGVYIAYSGIQTGSWWNISVSFKLGTSSGSVYFNANRYEKNDPYEDYPPDSVWRNFITSSGTIIPSHIGAFYSGSSGFDIAANDNNEGDVLLSNVLLYNKMLTFKEVQQNFFSLAPRYENQIGLIYDPNGYAFREYHYTY